MLRLERVLEHSKALVPVQQVHNMEPEPVLEHSMVLELVRSKDPERHIDVRLSSLRALHEVEQTIRHCSCLPHRHSLVVVLEQDNMALEQLQLQHIRHHLGA